MVSSLDPAKHRFSFSSRPVSTAHHPPPQARPSLASSHLASITLSPEESRVAACLSLLRIVSARPLPPVARSASCGAFCRLLLLPAAGASQSLLAQTRLRTNAYAVGSSTQAKQSKLSSCLSSPLSLLSVRALHRLPSCAFDLPVALVFDSSLQLRPSLGQEGC